MIYFLLALLIILLVISYLYFKRDLVAPAVIFIAGFVYCTIWACAYGADWDLVNMRADTFLVIFVGCLTFLLTSVVVHQLFKKHSKVPEKEKKSSALPALNVPVWFKAVSIIFMIVALFVSLNSVINISGESWSNIPAAINDYDKMTKFDEEIVSVPLIVTVFKMVAGALAYWFIYVFVYSLFIKQKKWWQRIDWLSIMNIILGVGILFSTGGRSGVVNMLITAVVIVVVLYAKKNQVNMKIRLKWVLPILVLFVGFLLLFPKINAILGRSVTDDTNYYLAIYSGAEIKNLDIFLDNRENGKFISSGNNQTFAYITNTAMKAFHFGEPYKLDLPFQNTATPDGRRLGLGNVYTAFYQFIYDYGYFGVVWCTALMAAISQFVYEKARRSRLGGAPNIYILVYGYFASSLLLSFFSNKFYEQNFNKAFIFNVVFWLILNFLVSKNFWLPAISEKLFKRKN